MNFEKIPAVLLAGKVASAQLEYRKKMLGGFNGAKNKQIPAVLEASKSASLQLEYRKKMLK